jgi:hypothetical protein
LNQVDQDGPCRPPQITRFKRASVTLLLLLSIPACSPARGHRVHSPNSPGAPVELQPGSPIVTSSSSAAPLQFRFAAAQASIFRLDIAQRDMRLQVTILNPDGSTLLEQSTPVTAATSIVAAAGLPGSYAVTIIPEHPDGRDRQLSITLADLGPSNSRRTLELAAATALKAGDDLASQWTREALD